MSSMTEPRAITDVLSNWTGGNEAELRELIPVVYEELKKTARAFFAREASDHPLQTTALVHEVYLRLVDCRDVRWQSREQFYAFAGQLMRRILVDYGRSRRASKRGGGSTALSLAADLDVPEPQTMDLDTLIDLDEALVSLAERDSRIAQIVELRFFAGLTEAEIAALLQISPATVRRGWKTARYWLARELA